jgi:hypothetical protein
MTHTGVNGEFSTETQSHTSVVLVLGGRSLGSHVLVQDFAQARKPGALLGCGSRRELLVRVLFDHHFPKWFGDCALFVLPGL